MSIDINHVGEYFYGPDGDIYQMVSYCEYPTATMQNVGSGHKIGGAVGSRNMEGFKRLPEGHGALVEKLLKQVNPPFRECLENPTILGNANDLDQTRRPGTREKR